MLPCSCSQQAARGLTGGAPPARTPPMPNGRLPARVASTGGLRLPGTPGPVSYTHLTLPTICSV
eukprot:7382079-Alexandrium_andersonii.AAC.2